MAPGFWAKIRFFCSILFCVVGVASVHAKSETCKNAIEVDITPRPDRLGREALAELFAQIPYGQFVSFSNVEPIPNDLRSLRVRAYKNAVKVSLGARSDKQEIPNEVLESGLETDNDQVITSPQINVEKETNPDLIFADAISRKNLKTLFYSSSAKEYEHLKFLGQLSYNTVSEHLFVDYLDFPAEIGQGLGQKIQKVLLAKVLSENPQVRFVHMILRFGTRWYAGDVPRVRQELTDAFSLIAQKILNENALTDVLIPSVKNAAIRRMKSKRASVLYEAPRSAAPKIVEESFEEGDGDGFDRAAEESIRAKIADHVGIDANPELIQREAWKKRIKIFSARTEFDLKYHVADPALLPRIPQGVFLGVEKRLNGQDKPFQYGINDLSVPARVAVLSSVSEVQAAVDLGLRVISAETHHTRAPFAEVVLDFKDFKTANEN